MEIVYFKAPWCTGCKTMTPIIESLNYDKKIVNVDEETEFALSNKIRNIPAVLIFKDGEEKHRFTGIRSQSEIQEIIDSL